MGFSGCQSDRDRTNYSVTRNYPDANHLQIKSKVKCQSYEVPSVINKDFKSKENMTSIYLQI